MEGLRLDRVHDVQIDLREHLELVPLPQNGAPIRLTAQRDQVLLFRRRGKGTAEELSTFDRDVFHVRLRQRLPLLLRLHLVDGDLRVWHRPLAVRDVTA